MLKLMRTILLPLAVALPLTAAHAQQPVFRSVMPDGKVVYGDKPAPGAKESKQVNLAPLNISAPTQPGSGAPDPAAASGNNSSEVINARQNLEAAQKALEAGRDVREGDRIGVAKGSGATSRPSEEYTQRVKALEDAVAAAQAQLETAQRNAAGQK